MSTGCTLTTNSRCALLCAPRLVSAPSVTPEYTMAVVDGRLQISIQLPQVTSVAEVEVDLSRQQLKLSSLKYSLTLNFPQPIDDGASTAKFVKKQATLKISAPVV